MRDEYRFPGFDAPNYTPCPDALFDELLPRLSESELKVLLYVVRRTFGFRKDADAISVSQMVSGITTHDGRVLDRGTGLSKSSVRRGVQGLLDKGILLVEKVRSPDGDYETNVYRLRFRQEVVPNSTHPGVKLSPPVVPNLTLQETVRQETERQEFEVSKGPNGVDKYDDDRGVILNFVADFAVEFADQAPLPSSVSRAQNLYRGSGLPLDAFADLMYKARQITKERSGSVKTVPDGAGRKHRMHYFFAVLEDLLQQAGPG